MLRTAYRRGVFSGIDGGKLYRGDALSTAPAGAAGMVLKGLESGDGRPRGETVMSTADPRRVRFVIWIVATRLSRE